MTHSAVHLGSGQFWGEIRGQGACTTFEKHLGRESHCHNRMGRHRIHWGNLGLKLQTKTGASANAKALKPFQHTLKKKHHQPFSSAKIIYGGEKQCTTEQLSASPLDKEGKQIIQQVCGKLLVLGRAVDRTQLFPISAIASQTATPP